MRIAITRNDLTRSDDELYAEFAEALQQARERPPRRGRARAEWHAVIDADLVANRTPQEAFAELVKRGQANDVSLGITDSRLQIGGATISWDTFKAYCYKCRPVKKKRTKKV